MQAVRSFSPLLRAIFVIGAVAALVTSITFAALTSTATLTNNTISSADSNLTIWDGAAFATTAPGFDVTDLVPGEGSDEYFYYLKSESDAPLYITVHVPAEPTAPEGGFDFTGWENLEVTFKSYAPGCGDDTVMTDMQALLDGEVELKCNPIAADAQGNNAVGAEETEGNYSVSFDIDPSSITGDDPEVGNFDMVFTGSVIDPSIE